MPARKKKPRNVNYLVAVGDTHCGCGLAICPPGVRLDDGGTYKPNQIQKELWDWWNEFWNKFVPKATRGEPYAVVHVGDAIDGSHHGSIQQITHNLTIQRRIARELLAPVVEKCEGRYYHIRGTEAHVGKSASEEEALAEELGAIPDRNGQHARYELWKKVGYGVIHALHHVGTTGSNAYEATGPWKELMEMCVESARWQTRRPDLIIRGHRHRYIEVGGADVRVGQDDKIVYDKIRVIVTPAWQSKTPFAWKIPGARVSQPQFGGVVVCYAEDHDVLFVKEFIRSPRPPEAE